MIRTAASNHPCSQLFSTPLSKRRRRARTAYGHGCRLSIAHARSNGPLPRLARCFRASRPHGSSPDGGKTSCAASRRDWPFRSHEKPRGANFRGGLAEYGNLMALPETRLLRARMPRQTLTAAAAQGRRAAHGFSGLSTTAREARRLAAVAPAAGCQREAFFEMGPRVISLPPELFLLSWFRARIGAGTWSGLAASASGNRL